MLELLSAIGSILLVDIVLSGDNALVIGATAAGLPQQQRRLAILAGGGSAVILRILFAFLASFLLLLPWLQGIGGLALLFIAIRLLLERQRKHKATPNQQEHAAETPLSSAASRHGLLSALLMILVADVTMSLDNVLAVGALAHGNLLALALGILLSVVLLLIGSLLVAELIKWLPWLLDIAALVLAWTGAGMILHDQRLGDTLNDYTWTAIAVPALFLGVVLLADGLFWLRSLRMARLS